MCFAPQQRALFQHLNFQKCSDTGVLSTFDFTNVEVFLAFVLHNVLRTTDMCNFSSLILPNGSAPAALASLLCDLPEPQIIGKTQCFATLLLFHSRASSFFGLFLFSDLLSSSCLFSDASHLCFSICPLCHIVGSLTSKLPSRMDI